MADLIEWLRAQIDGDERHAQKDLWALDRATAQGNWEAHYGYNLPQSYLMTGDLQVAVLTVHRQGLADGEEDQHAADALLVARLVRKARERATRVLREVEAKRRILDEHAPREDCATACKVCSGWYASCGCVGGDDFPCTTVRLLAAPYSDRPGYREEWRP